MSLTVSGVAASRYAREVSGGAHAPTASQKMSSVFDKIDVSGTGSITRAQLAQKFKGLNLPEGIKALGPDAVFSALDQSKTGSVDKKKFSSGMIKLLSTLKLRRRPLRCLRPLRRAPP